MSPQYELLLPWCAPDQLQLVFSYHLEQQLARGAALAMLLTLSSWVVWAVHGITMNVCSSLFPAPWAAATTTSISSVDNSDCHFDSPTAPEVVGSDRNLDILLCSNLSQEMIASKVTYRNHSKVTYSGSWIPSRVWFGSTLVVSFTSKYQLYSGLDIVFGHGSGCFSSWITSFDT